MTPQPTSPRTAAGRALLADPASGGSPGKTWQDGWRTTILAIEAQALADTLDVERLARALIPWFGGEWEDEGNRYAARQGARAIAAEYLRLTEEK